MAGSLSLDAAGGAGWRTERLRLAALGNGDDVLYRATYTDASLMRYVGQPLSVDRADASFRTALAENVRRPWRRLTWALRGPTSADALGLIGVIRDPGDATRAEIGAIIQPRWQGRGLATEALRALAARCLSTPSINTAVLIRHHVDNAGGMAIARALGFVRAPDQDIDEWRLWCCPASGGA